MIPTSNPMDSSCRLCSPPGPKNHCGAWKASNLKSLWNSRMLKCRFRGNQWESLGGISLFLWSLCRLRARRKRREIVKKAYKLSSALCRPRDWADSLHSSKCNKMSMKRSRIRVSKAAYALLESEDQSLLPKAIWYSHQLTKWIKWAKRSTD